VNQILQETAMEKSIIIIGGGLTGLALGCYGRMNGYKTTIFEMHKIAGGVCTGWKRKGYIIDGAVNWVMGTKPGTSYHKFWEEVGAAQRWKVYNHDYYTHIELEGDDSFSFYSDVDRLEQYMKGIAPEDKEVIEELTNGIRSMVKIDLSADKPPELTNIIDKIKMVKMLPFARLMKKWGNVTMGDFGRRFNNPLLRKVFSGDAMGDVSSFPMAILIMMFAFFSQKDAGYVIGGSLALVSYIQQRYHDLGGEIHFKSRVEKILVENDKAVGIRLADGTEHRADWVVSAADGHTTIFDMLDGKYIDDTIRGYYDNPNLYSPLIYIGLGVNRSFDDIPSAVSGLTFPLDEPVTVAGKERKRLNVLIYNFDPNFAPEGKTTLVVSLDTDYDYWEELYKDPEQYKAEKEKIADLVVSLLDKRFPGLAGQVEMRDIATPMTWVRYTGNWRGSYEGWMMSLESFTTQMRKTLPGLENFYMAGQWVNPGGGIPTAIMSGRNTIQVICKKDGKKFVTTKP
jgi:phytoene dehydrogenase-like protein